MVEIVKRGCTFNLKLMGSLFGPITLETGIEKVSIGDKTEFYYNIVGFYNYRFYDAHINEIN